MAEDVKWTAREAMACAYCWAEFANPEARGDDPVTYWLGITEKARSECRTIANKRLLLAVARKQAVPLLPPDSLTNDDKAAIGAAMRLKAWWRVNRCIYAVYQFAAKRVGANA